MLQDKNGLGTSSELELDDESVHVWRATMDVTSDYIDIIRDVLCIDEIKRADRFYFQKDRNNYIVARGLLRRILSHYCDKDPDEHIFAYNRYGKPYLVDEDILYFNVSHSDNQVLYAVTLGREIGIDIERIRPFENAESIIERFCSEKEKKDFLTLSDSNKNEAFFTCWTRKEAYIKAHGKGLVYPLDEFTVTFLPGEPAVLSDTQNDINEKDNWSIKDIPVTAGYVGAVAVKGHNMDYCYLDWKW